METNKGKKTILDIMDKVDLEMLHQSTKYSKQYLEEEGLNIEEEQEFAVKFIKKIRFMSSALVSKRNDESLLERAFLQVKKSINENLGHTTDVLVNLLKTKTPSVQYRKLENWTDDEIRDVLADVNLIELIEELENKTE